MIQCLNWPLWCSLYLPHQFTPSYIICTLCLQGKKQKTKKKQGYHGSSSLTVKFWVQHSLNNVVIFSVSSDIYFSPSNLTHNWLEFFFVITLDGHMFTFFSNLATVWTAHFIRLFSPILPVKSCSINRCKCVSLTGQKKLEYCNSLNVAQLFINIFCEWCNFLAKLGL